MAPLSLHFKFNGLNILNQDHNRLQKPSAGRLADRQERALDVEHAHRPRRAPGGNRPIRIPEVFGRQGIAVSGSSGPPLVDYDVGKP
jgi:hypothetical protein